MKFQALALGAGLLLLSAPVRGQAPAPEEPLRQAEAAWEARREPYLTTVLDLMRSAAKSGLPDQDRRAAVEGLKRRGDAYASRLAKGGEEALASERKAIDELKARFDKEGASALVPPARVAEKDCAVLDKRAASWLALKKEQRAKCKNYAESLIWNDAHAAEYGYTALDARSLAGPLDGVCKDMRDAGCPVHAGCHRRFHPR